MAELGRVSAGLDLRHPARAAAAHQEVGAELEALGLSVDGQRDEAAHLGVDEPKALVAQEAHRPSFGGEGAADLPQPLCG